MKLMQGTRSQKILALFCLAIAAALVIIAVVDISAFHINEIQLDNVITKAAAAKTQQEVKVISITTLAVKEQNNVRVVLLQYADTDIGTDADTAAGSAIGTGADTAGVENGVAVFTKLPLLPLYRFDGFYPTGGNSIQFASVIDTGLTQELIVAAGTDITISTAGLGKVLDILIGFIPIAVIGSMILIARKLSRTEGISPFFK